jgi:rubrerythrin
MIHDDGIHRRTYEPMICSVCGEPFDEDGFCPICGRTIEDDEDDYEL